MKLEQVCHRVNRLALLAGLVVGVAMLILLAVAPRAAAQEQRLPSGKDVLDKYLEATGGRPAYEAVQNRVTEMTMELPAAGIKGKMTMYQAKPDKGFIVMDMGQQLGKVEQGRVGDLVWEVSPMTGTRLIDGQEKDALVRGLDLGSELNPDRYYDKIETVGAEDVNGTQTWKVEFTTPAGNKETRYYAQDSGLLLKTESKTQTQMGEIDVVGMTGDYEQFGDIKMPKTMTQEMMGQKIVLTIDNVKHNVDIPASRFTVPDEVKKLMAKQEGEKSVAPATQPRE